MNSKEEILKKLFNAGHITLDELMILQANSGSVNLNPITPWIQPHQTWSNTIPPYQPNPVWYQVTCNG